MTFQKSPECVVLIFLLFCPRSYFIWTDHFNALLPSLKNIRPQTAASSGHDYTFLII